MLMICPNMTASVGSRTFAGEQPDVDRTAQNRVGFQGACLLPDISRARFSLRGHPLPIEFPFAGNGAAGLLPHIADHSRSTVHDAMRFAPVFAIFAMRTSPMCTGVSTTKSRAASIAEGIDRSGIGLSVRTGTRLSSRFASAILTVVVRVRWGSSVSCLP